jgi:hypothetical protein
MEGFCPNCQPEKYEEEFDKKYIDMFITEINKDQDKLKDVGEDERIEIRLKSYLRKVERQTGRFEVEKYKKEESALETDFNELCDNKDSSNIEKILEELLSIYSKEYRRYDPFMYVLLLFMLKYHQRALYVQKRPDLNYDLDILINKALVVDDWQIVARLFNKNIN